MRGAEADSHRRGGALDRAGDPPGAEPCETVWGESRVNPWTNHPGTDPMLLLNVLDSHSRHLGFTIPAFPLPPRKIWVKRIKS